MPAGYYDMTLEQGATFRVEVQWVDGDGVPVDLTDCTARMQGRPFGGGNPIVDLSSSDGTITFPAAGVILLHVPSSDTADVPPPAARTKDALYDLVVSFPNGDESRLLEGKLKVSPGQTR